MLKNFLTAAAVFTALLSTSATMAREVLINVPVICDHRATILNDAANIFNITELVFLGRVLGDGGAHFEMWTDKAGEKWVALMVKPTNVPDGVGGMVDITVACVMGTGGDHEVYSPAEDAPAEDGPVVIDPAKGNPA